MKIDAEEVDARDSSDDLNKIRYELTKNLDQSRWVFCLPTDFRLAIPWIAILHDMDHLLPCDFERRAFAEGSSRCQTQPRDCR